MEFDLHSFQMISREPIFRIDKNGMQFFKIAEKKNSDRVFTLITMNSCTQQIIQSHLQCQSVSSGIVQLKGHRDMSSTDSFGLCVERTGWLVEELHSTLNMYCQETQTIPFIKILNELIETLATFQEEEITLTELTMQSIVITKRQNFKILDLSSAISLMGMSTSVVRQITGDPIHLDPDAHRASLQGESFLDQNYFKSIVYAFGIIMLQVASQKQFERRQTQQEIQALLGLIEVNYGETISKIISKMLSLNREHRPDCIELRSLIHYESMKQPPHLLGSNFNESLLSMALSNTSKATQLLHPEIHKYQQDANTLEMQFTCSEYITTSKPEVQIQKPQVQIQKMLTDNLDNLQDQAYEQSDQGSAHNSQLIVVLPSFLKREIIQYQNQRFDQRTSQSEQGQGESKNNEDIDELVDYLQRSGCIPKIDLQDINIDRNNFLGRGTEGSVYVCSVGQCQNMAVKILEQIENSWAVEILLNTSSVQSRNIKGIFKYNFYAIEHADVGVSSEEDQYCNLYLISNRMRCDLSYANINLNLNDSQKIQICHQIAQVLKQLQNQVIHGDLKPQNILLDSSNNINIIDFGMSRVLSKTSLVESAGHTYLYSPPEQVLMKNAHSKSDIWSFGIIIYEIFMNKQITQDIIHEMGMYDTERKGSLKLDRPLMREGLSLLINQMTQFDYQMRPSMEQVIESLLNSQNQRIKVVQHQKRIQSGCVKKTSRNSTPQKLKNYPRNIPASASTQLMVQGQQIKNEQIPKHQVPKVPHTQFEKREKTDTHVQRQISGTQINTIQNKRS